MWFTDYQTPVRKFIDRLLIGIAITTVVLGLIALGIYLGSIA